MSDVQPLTVTPEVLAQLQAPTPASARKTRQGPGGRSLSYVDARYVQGVLDSDVGPANWQDEYQIGAAGKVGCRIGIRVDFGEGPEWVWKGDGAGETDIEGEKGSFSDAFKRAAVKWGIARDLYADAPAQPVGQAAIVQPQPAPLPQATPLPPLPAGTVPYQDQGSANEDVCPEHNLAWVLKPGGVSKKTNKAYDAFWTCGKQGTPYCNEKPSKAWQARREVGQTADDDLPF